MYTFSIHPSILPIIPPSPFFICFLRSVSSSTGPSCKPFEVKSGCRY
jgi:hypothetical protein